MYIIKIINTIKDGYSFKKCEKIRLYCASHAASIPPFTYRNNFLTSLTEEHQQRELTLLYGVGGGCGGYVIELKRMLEYSGMNSN